MSISLALLLGAAMCYSGKAALCLGMDRHHQQIWASKSPVRQFGLRVGGWLLLALALWPCIEAWGGSVGVVIWCGLLSSGALLLTLLMSYVPKVSALLMVMSMLGSVAMLWWGVG